MICKKCKKELPDESLYCNWCGAPQKRDKKKKLYQRPDGLFEKSITINNKRIVFRGKSEAEIDRKMLEYEETEEHGLPFRLVAEEWEEAHFQTLSHNTIKSYRPALVRAIDTFQDEPIKEIKPPQIKNLLNSLARKGMAKKTVSTQLLICSLICGYALEHGYLDHNPCTDISIPKNLSRSRRDAATVEDEERVKNNYHVWLLPFLILYTGLRKGEALALTYGDIHDGEIHISKSVYHESNKPMIKTPKTAAGVRSVPILSPLADKLPSGSKNRYIFSMDNGKTPLTEMQYQKLWKEFAEKTGISATAHQLRHSYATMLHENDIDIKEAQGLLGHANAAMTADVYTHLRDSHKQKVVARLNEKLCQLDNKKSEEN